MKYFSEVLNKKFDTENELLEAEKAYDDARKEEEKKASMTIANKKELAKKIDVATDNLNSAYEQYDLERAHAREIMIKAQKESNSILAKAQKDSEEILENARKECREILTPAKENIRTKQQEKFEALTEFSSKYGTYTTTLTGDKALNEMRRIDSWTSDYLDYFKNIWFNH